ncbi:MAG: hypothetical protein NWF05_07860 [Candidatus Bathyarchaeota archaeon]|nr:hypothetical protein [Candidatus Bathyarchaeota archaeon]
MQRNEEELNSTTFGIYLYLVKVKEPAAPREIMRAMNISSPGVVNRHLQKLMDWGWVSKDVYGRFNMRKKVSFKGHLWLGRTLLPTSLLFFPAFIAFTAIVIAALVSHMLNGGTLSAPYIALIVVIVVLAPILLAEALRPRRRQPKEPLKL